MTIIPQVLTIAGSDSGGGAGIQADIKTFQELGVYSTSVITAVTAQNTLGVQAIYPVETGGIETQLRSIGSDFNIAALKTGMLFNAEIIRAVANKIKEFGWVNCVVDPVMIAKGGANLLQSEAVEALQQFLLPLATAVTPNIPEAEAITGIIIKDELSRQKAAEEILSYGPESVVIKGGHGTDPVFTEDFYMNRQGESIIFRSPRIATNQTHGTGCTFAAAVTSELAKGSTMKDAVHIAKQFIQAALSDELHIGAGHGPTNHAAYRAELIKGSEVVRIEAIR